MVGGIITITGDFYFRALEEVATKADSFIAPANSR
jgi:hypothetical protein